MENLGNRTEEILFEDINGKHTYTGSQTYYNKHNEKRQDFFTTLTITGIFNKRDIIIFLLGALLFFSSKQTLKENTNEN